MGKFKDLTGHRFDRLTVIKRAPNKNEYVMWECQCDCGNTVVVRSGNLTQGKTKSCGCLKVDHIRKVGKPYFKHGETKTRLYRIWTSMKNRCDNESHMYYMLYGGRGIKVCDEWHDDYVTFKSWAMNNGYNDVMSIDRIDNDKGYEPDNCRFIYYKDQPKNRRTNHMVKVNGEEITASECSRKYGIPLSTVVERDKKGIDILKGDRLPYNYSSKEKPKGYHKCRYCAYCFDGGDEYRCSAMPNNKELYMNEQRIKRLNNCKYFVLSDLGCVITGKQYHSRNNARKSKTENDGFEQLSFI